MPVYEYKCKNCGHIMEYYQHVSEDILRERVCDICEGKAVKILSAFNTGQTLFKRLSGVDDTENLTFGKIVADGKIPAEFKRKNKERIDRYNRFSKEYKRRKEMYRFREGNEPNDPKPPKP